MMVVSLIGSTTSAAKVKGQKLLKQAQKVKMQKKTTDKKKLKSKGCVRCPDVRCVAKVSERYVE